jgi:hypothetical protein
MFRKHHMIALGLVGSSVSLLSSCGPGWERAAILRPGCTATAGDGASMVFAYQ